MKQSFLVRAALTLVFAWVCTGVWAEEVTEKEALQQAQAFVNSHLGRKGGGPQLMSLGKVSGLYVFNMTEKGGFVIVSNEDCTVPVLGYSDTGTLDPSDLPDNMRAWLQGYADEIAWLRSHEDSLSRASRASRVPRRVGSHSTEAIAPLVSTTWNQGEPYNNQTPYYKRDDNGYSYSKTPAEGYTHCATGCVATAMAQVMYYHQWPQAATQTIPAYQWRTFWLPEDSQTPLAATTLDWENMLTTYELRDPVTGDKTVLGTDVQQQAIATLMQYCGYAVEMNYGRESGSNTVKVAAALKTCFDYHPTTTTFVSRSAYSYANWTDLIYYELAHARPVVYGGQSSRGGHEFVCDGYACENGTDYFHINWGWGGKSDEYYVLSALNPYSGQGIGGSTSNDGFHYGQDAVIGIQPSTGTGTLSDIPSVSEVSLVADTMTLSSSTLLLGGTVTVTVHVTNTSETADYDGDIYVGRKTSSWSLVVGDVFTIPAGQSRDCALTFRPASTGTYDLVFFYPGNNGKYYTEGDILATLTVVDALGNGATDNSAVISSADGVTASVTLADRTLYRDGAWNTLCLPFSVTDGDTADGITFSGTQLAGATVMALDTETPVGGHLTGLDGTTLHLNFQPVDEIVAGTPYIIRWDAAAPIENPVFHGVTIDKTLHDVQSADGAVTFRGAYDSHTFAAADPSILFLGTGNTLYWPQSGATIGACRAYFQLTAASGVRAFSLHFGDGETAVAAPSQDAWPPARREAAPASAAWHTLCGVRLGATPAAPGVYIRNGRKAVIK